MRLGSLLGSLVLLAGTSLISQPQTVQADLPVHCLVSDVEGEWDFYLGPKKTTGPDACSSDEPNTNLRNLQLWDTSDEQKLKEVDFSRDSLSQKYTVVLTSTQSDDPDAGPGWKKLLVKTTSGTDIGHWTMVYDEGFEVRITDPNFIGTGAGATAGPRTFFAFSGYAPLCSARGNMAHEFCQAGGQCTFFNKKNGDGEQSDGSLKCYMSKCGRTTLGWHHSTTEANPAERQWGCFSARKKGDTSSFVVIKSLVKKGKKHGVDPASFVENHNKKESSWTARVYDFRSLHRQYDKFGLHMPQIEGFSFLQRTSATVNSNSRSQAVQKSRGNIDIDSSSQLFACPEPTAVKDTQPFVVEPVKSFSWVTDLKSYPQPTDQGSCGSCYAVAATYVFQTRIQIALEKVYGITNASYPVLLSPQHVLSCSFYNQGCNGGYPFLVGKWASDYGIPEDACMKYQAKDTIACPGTFNNQAGAAMLETNADFTDARDANNTLHDNVPGACHDVWYAKDYGYVGGHYEHCSEGRMMKEIHENGPVVVAMDAPNDLSFYSNGVLDVQTEGHAKFCDTKNADMNGWEYTDHALVVVGWGEEPASPSCPRCCTKYWLVRNSWGKNWGQDGYVKICRGKNLGAIENQAVFITPDLTKGRAYTVARALATKNRPAGSFFQSSVSLHQKDGPVAM